MSTEEGAGNWGPGPGSITTHSLKDRTARTFTPVGWKQWGEKRRSSQRTFWPQDGLDGKTYSSW